MIEFMRLNFKQNLMFPKSACFAKEVDSLNPLWFQSLFRKRGKHRFCVDPGTNVNADYYCNVLLTDLIPQMDRLANRKPYLFMQDGARAHTAGMSVDMLRHQKHLKLLEPQHWLPNSPDLNPVDYCVWGILEKNIYRKRGITDTEMLKEATIEEWEKKTRTVIDDCVVAFKS